MIVASSSSSDDDVSLGVDQKKAPASTHDTASSIAVPRRRGDVPSKRGQFSCKYEAYGKDDLSM
jgi:hypothetical protein